MATLLRSRRFANRTVVPTQQYLTFRLRQYWFAIPMEALQRVSTLNSQTFFNEMDIRLTAGEQQDVELIDVDRQIFAQANEGSAQHPAPALVTPENPASAHCLVIFKISTGQIFGLPIDSQPKLQRMLQSSFISCSDSPQPWDSLRSICSQLVLSNDNDPIFLLDLERLCKV